MPIGGSKNPKRMFNFRPKQNATSGFEYFETASTGTFRKNSDLEFSEHTNNLFDNSKS